MSPRALSAAQCRAARGLLGWTQADLGRAAGIARKTIADFELGNRRLRGRTLSSIAAALEGSGVVFLADQDGAGEGVRLSSAARRPVAPEAVVTP